VTTANAEGSRDFMNAGGVSLAREEDCYGSECRQPAVWIQKSRFIVTFRAETGLSSQPLPPMNLNYIVSLLCLVLWVVALIDCIRSPVSNKVVWIIVIILLPFLGSILYFLLAKKS
jgi:hypothetical protein